MNTTIDNTNNEEQNIDINSVLDNAMDNVEVTTPVEEDNIDAILLNARKSYNMTSYYIK